MVNNTILVTKFILNFLINLILNFFINFVLTFTDVIDNCIKAYKNTIERDKTINIEAFVDNLYKEFRKIVL